MSMEMRDDGLVSDALDPPGAVPMHWRQQSLSLWIFRICIQHKTPFGFG